MRAVAGPIPTARRPDYRWRGAVLGACVLLPWMTLWTLGLFWWRPAPAQALGVMAWVAAQTVLSTGVFIVAHDAMHGTLMPRDRAWNHRLGALCVTLFGLFSYRWMRHRHLQHHERPGRPGDPDHHTPGPPGFLAWYRTFMGRYASAGQVLGMAIVFNGLWLVGGVPFGNLVIFWVVPALLASIQLFAFGTWLPHRGAAEAFDSPHRARSNDLPEWLSLLTCFHFGYHLEHHRWPFVPWWRLPEVRRAGLGRAAGRATT